MRRHIDNDELLGAKIVYFAGKDRTQLHRGRQLFIINDSTVYSTYFSGTTLENWQKRS
jgi:hypothetical protein